VSFQRAQRPTLHPTKTSTLTESFSSKNRSAAVLATCRSPLMLRNLLSSPVRDSPLRHLAGCGKTARIVASRSLGAITHGPTPESIFSLSGCRLMSFSSSMDDSGNELVSWSSTYGVFLIDRFRGQSLHFRISIRAGTLFQRTIL
jgi:hypothetical protein